jgi:hypothetical protein
LSFSISKARETGAATAKLSLSTDSAAGAYTWANSVRAVRILARFSANMNLLI